MSWVLEAHELSKWYGQVIAVNKVTFSIAAGVTGLLGPNGAGKSTLMKLMTGQLRPSQGRLTVFGQPIWNNYGLFHRIGLCPEQDSFYERMTGGEFLASLLRLHGLREARRAVDPSRLSRGWICRLPATRRLPPTARECGSESSWHRL